MGSRITKLQPVNGFAAETGAATAVAFATHFGIPVSTTHAITGAIVGVGATRRWSAVRWGVAGQIVWAWVLTIPAAAAIGAGTLHAAAGPGNRLAREPHAAGGQLPMRVYLLQSSTTVPRGIGEVFAFHADASNLQAITPPWLDFRILTASPIAMRPGALIRYRLRLRGVPIRWLTEITAWEPPHRFVDEQRRGPYRLWVHEHRFEAVEAGTRIDDTVRYAVPFGPLVHGWAVAPDVRRIFAYRHGRLLEHFGGDPCAQPPRITMGRLTPAP